MRFRLLFRDTRVALFAPTGEKCAWLSQGLSLLQLAVAPPTARKYAHAVRRLLNAGRADLGLLAQLEQSREAAQRAIRRLLSRAGCQLEHHRLPNGGVLVSAPAALVPCVDTALTALGRCYTLLGDRGEIGFDPVHGPAGHPALLPGPPSRQRPRQFVVANRRRSRPLTDDPRCAELARSLAKAWPPGVAAALDLTAGEGDRIGETLDLALADFAASGFGDWVACPNKGSRGERTKKLYLDPVQRAGLVAWIDGPRKEMTGLGLAELQRIHRRNPDAPELRQPLFLNTRGRRISYSLFNDYYWRPALRKAGSKATPHWLRHEDVTDALLLIRAMGLPKGEEEEMIRILASLKGWASGPDMVFYYSASLDDFDRRKFLERLAAARDAAPPAPPTEDGDDDPVLAAFAAGRVS